MRVIVLGGDGYLGWPTAMRFAARGYDVWAVDNYLPPAAGAGDLLGASDPQPQPGRTGPRSSLR
jgi:nucleoside-diphosphate-sugar epimerase